mgnify:CR=1 FL=1
MEKMAPWTRPIFDVFEEYYAPDQIEYMINDNKVEVAPLAFMRGRTLDNAFVILDEAQNATVPQMKMFLTRMGKHAKFIITGDVSQVDLPRHQKSGLIESLERLSNVEGISVVRLTTTDVIRHRLVKKIIEAFETE